MRVLLDIFCVDFHPRQYTVQTSSKMMQSKRMMDDGTIIINNSNKEIPLRFVSVGVTVEVAMSLKDNAPLAIVEEGAKCLFVKNIV